MPIVPMENNGLDETKESVKTKKLNKYAFASVVVASIISVIFGYVSGVMSGALLFIKEDLKISDLQVQLLAGIVNAFAIPGSMVAGRTMDYVGRRYTFVIASLIYLLGSLLMGYGPSYLVLMIGRCTLGVGVGFALTVAGVYGAEISPPDYRGFLASVPDMSINLGVLIAYVSNYFFGKLSLRLGWRLMVGAPAIPSLALAIVMFKMIESPRWLVMQGRLAEAQKVLLLVSNSEREAQRRLADIKVAAGIPQDCTQDFVQVPKVSREGGRALKDLLWKPSPTVRRILIAAVGLQAFMHITGFGAILIYTPRILQKTGMTDKSKLMLATVGIGVSKTIVTFIATLLIDRVGRRVLLLISAGGMMVTLVGLGICLTIVEHYSKPLWAIGFTIVVVYAYVAFMSIGIGPVTWVYSSEIFPLRLRAQGLGISVAVNRISNVLVLTTFISVYKKITMGGTFFMFSGITVLAWCFYYFFLPETKGRSLEDMEDIFGKDGESHIQMSEE